MVINVSFISENNKEIGIYFRHIKINKFNTSHNNLQLEFNNY